MAAAAALCRAAAPSARWHSPNNCEQQHIEIPLNRDLHSGVCCVFIFRLLFNVLPPFSDFVRVRLSCDKQIHLPTRWILQRPGQSSHRLPKNKERKKQYESANINIDVQRGDVHCRQTEHTHTHTHCVEALFWFCCCCSLSCFCCFALIARCAWWFWIFPTVKCANSVTVNLRMVHIFSFHLAYCLTDRGWWSFVERERRRRLRMLRHRRRHNHSRYHREIYNHSMNGRLL